ncbi:hypothetical protein KPH14_012624 [Odynerus spinipes]|uniref:Uncharacterized protein n=1 Tax=Odynerus spinipes TaxID=1348599 RepID=A0AAD9RER6_9HYME|nr:hypothetical protein KPH14_012624 [Odynerus spinipes]
MVHSRWLTTANRILTLYVATTNPSYNLKTLVEYVMKVYAPVWFSIKMQSSFKDGAKHIFKMISFSRYLPENLKSVIDAVIERNSFFAHPENLLVSMLFDTRSHVRELSLKRILKARVNDVSARVRVFKIPKLNFSAEDYIDVIVWNECQVTSPPILFKYSNEELIRIVQNNDLQVDDFLCHTQAVERCVKSVTEVSQRVIGPEARHGFIKNRIESRNQMPSFNYKSQFFVK